MPFREEKRPSLSHDPQALERGAVGGERRPRLRNLRLMEPPTDIRLIVGDREA